MFAISRRAVAFRLDSGRCIGDWRLSDIPEGSAATGPPVFLVGRSKGDCRLSDIPEGSAAMGPPAFLDAEHLWSASNLLELCPAKFISLK